MTLPRSVPISSPRVRRFRATHVFRPSALVMALAVLLIGPAPTAGALPGPGMVGRVGGAWAKAHFDAANTGKNAGEDILGLANVAKLKKRWAFHTGGMIRSSPVVIGHIVYVGSNDGRVYALSEDLGVQLWSFATKGGVESVPDVAGGVLFVGSDDGNVYALNAITGHRLWTFATHGPVSSSPNALGNLLYVGSSDHSLYALHASDGTKAWAFTTGGAITSTPAVFGGRVYVSSWDGNVYALDAKSGRLVRTFRTKGPIVASPALASYGGIDWLIIGSTDHTVYAFNANTGIVKWKYLTAGDVYSTVAISASERAVFIGTHNWNIEAHYLDTGVERWLYSCPHGLAVYASPAVANGVVYFACRNGAAYALDSTKRKWEAPGVPGSPGSPGSPAAPASPGSIMRLPDWSYQTNGPIYSSPAVADGMLFIGSDDGRVYAFGL